MIHAGPHTIKSSLESKPDFSETVCTYFLLHLLEIQNSNLGDFADDVEPVVLLVGHRIP